MRIIRDHFYQYQTKVYQSSYLLAKYGGNRMYDSHPYTTLVAAINHIQWEVTDTHTESYDDFDNLEVQI